MIDIIWQTINFKKKAITSIKKRGIVYSLRLGFKALISIFWLEKKVFKMDTITKNIYKLSRPLPGLELREASSGDFPELLMFSRHFSKKEMFDRFAHSHRCFIARADNKIVFYGWVGINEAYVPMLGKLFKLPADTVCFYNAFTDEKYRHRRIFLAFMSKVREFSMEHGFPFGLVLLDAEIGLNLNVYPKLVGAYKIFLIRYRRRFGIKTYSTQEISIKDTAAVSERYRSRGKAD